MMEEKAARMGFVVFFLAIGITMSLVGSAAVFENKRPSGLSEKQQLDMKYGGCDDGRVFTCRTLPLFNYTDLAPTSFEGSSDVNGTQKINCPYNNLEQHLRCVDVFTRRCLTNEQRRSFYMIYTIPTLDMQELCTEGSPYRLDFLKHAECLRTVHERYVQCTHRHKRSAEALIMDDYVKHKEHMKQEETSSVSTEHINTNLNHLCKSFRGHLNCIHGIVGATCGPETEAFASQFLSQMSSSLLNICDSFGNDNDEEVTRLSTSSATLERGTGELALSVMTTVVILATTFQMR